MSTKPNILLEVAALSMQLSSKYLQPYSAKFSLQKFTQSQLLTCLILRAYLKTTYQGVLEFLGASSELRKVLELKRLPLYSTLKYFADRSNVAEISNVLMAEIIRQCEPSTTEATIDSTGVETTSASAHFQSRSGKSRQKYVKISVCVLVGSLLPAGVVASWGPSNDKQQAQVLIERSAESVTPKRLFADAGYDAEWVHELCCDHLARKGTPGECHQTGGPSDRRRDQRKVSFADDGRDIEEKEVWETLERGVVHECVEADDGFDALGPQRTSIVHRSHPSSSGLRPPALAVISLKPTLFKTAIPSLVNIARQLAKKIG